MILCDSDNRLSVVVNRIEILAIVFSRVQGEVRAISI